MIIRDAVPADAEAIAQIYNESIAAGDCALVERLQTSADILGWMASFNERETILVLEEDGCVLGWGIIKRYSEREGYRYTCETSVYLRRGQRGRGYGPMIKQALIERCRQYGYHHLVAKLFADNEACLKYNQKFGYELVGVQKEIGYKNGQWMDVAILQLLLPDESSNIDATKNLPAGETD
ncbi:MAG: N-acetyltransferase family protein [Candidatus Omnitrophota bacterium]